MRKLLMVLVLLALPVSAQNVDIEALSGLQFNFGNPGARSLGMGGSFLGLADDASAAEANPAGLTILRKPEVSIEARNYLEQQVFSTSGTYPETVRTPFTYYSDRVVIGFASAVIPIKNKFTVGMYYHEPLNNKGGGIVAPQFDELTGDLISRTPNFWMAAGGGEPISEEQCEALRRQTNNPGACFDYRLDPFVSALNVRQRTFGVAGAWQVHPKFSLGLAVRHQRFIESAFTFRYTSQLEPSTISVQATAEEKDGQVNIVEQNDTTFSVGFKWTPRDSISVGGVYKKGPSFEAPLFYNGFETGYEYAKIAETKFHLPDIAGIGISVRPMPVLTVNFDAVYLTYENLVDEFAATVADVRELEDPFGVDNGLELRLGAEYFFATKIPFALRAGVWHDPAHSIEWRGPTNRPDYVAEAILYPEGEDQMHYSIGVGFAWPKFQIDAAYDSSKHYKVGSISMVTRF